MKKFFTALFAVIFIAMSCLSFTACANPFNDEEDGKDHVDGKITLKVAVLNSDNEKSAMRALKKAYELKNPDINISIKTMRSDYANSIVDFVKTPSTFPDVVWTPGEYHSAFSQAGHFINLKPLMDADPSINTEDFYESVMEITHYNNTDDGVWFAPRDYNKPVVIINREMFRLAGIEVPSLEEWNIDKFFEICQKLRVKMDNINNSEEEKLAGLLWSSYPVEARLDWNPSYLSWIDNYGGEMFDTSKTGEASISFDSEESKDAYKEIWDKFVRTRYAPGIGGTGLFSSKAAGMWITVRPEIPALCNAKMDIDFLPMPTEKVAMGCSGYAIPAVTKDRLDPTDGNTKTNAELAWDFVKFIISEEGQDILGKIGTGIPVLKSMASRGSWRNFYNAELNHEAFVSAPEKDMSQMVYYQFNPVNHVLLLKQMNNVANTMLSMTTWSGTPLDIEKPGTASYGKLDEELANIRKEVKKLI